MRLRYLLGALCAAFSLPATAAIPATEQTVAVEFHHAATAHYFITAEPAEINDLDTGKHAGWARTGYRFSVIKAGSAYPGTVPMCRFFSESLNTHFYSAKPSECEEMKTKFPGVWIFESAEVFRSFAVDPNTGLCPADTTATYRLWNQQPAANHRYTDQLAAYVFMLSKGYMPEGDGSPALPVAFCTPAGGDVVPAALESAPNCTMTASTSNPQPGSTLALNAQCTNNPTIFYWQGCASTTSSCNATKTTNGQATYTLYAANAQGPGDPVTMNIQWGVGGGGGGGGAVPICTITANTAKPAAGSTLALTASCSQTPTSYEWLECSYYVQSVCNLMSSCPATSSTCNVTTTIAGFARYAVAASNGAGKGQRAPIDVEWTGGSNPPPGGGNPPPGGGGPDPVPVCSLFASNLQPNVGSSIILTSSCTGNPTSYTWSGVSCSQWQCQATSGAAGSITYSVTAFNASGQSTAYVAVEWGGQAPNPVPACTVTPSNSSPQVGSTISVTASCTNGPTTYTWTGCASTGSSCNDSSAVVGAKSYTVVATNANGNSPPATAVVDWIAVPTSPPACQIAASSSSPTVGQSITLTATCSNGPTSFNWTGCTSTGPTCNAAATAAGAVTYYVAGVNQYGTGNVAGVQVAWQTAGGGGGGGGGGGFCSQFTSVTQIDVAWGDGTRFKTSQYNGFGADKVFVVSFTVPSSPSSYGQTGYSSMFEYGGPPSLRHVTVSKSPCDFRSVDPSGASGPLAEGGGVQATISWNVGVQPVGLVPGTTYYFNYRNLNCAGNCDAMIENYWPK